VVLAVVAPAADVAAGAAVSVAVLASLPHEISTMLRAASEARVLWEVLGVIIDLQFTDGVDEREP
jgi:hypothetical protein